MEISDEIQEKLALLKSNFLSEIIIYAEKDDFDFTDYFKYDYLTEDTLKEPDEVWEFDREVLVLRKFFSEEGGGSYSQLVLALKASAENPLMLILSFVTRHQALAGRFCQGVPVKINTHH